MRRSQPRTRLQRRIAADAEFDELLRSIDPGLREMPAIGLGDVLRLGAADAELDGIIAVLLGRGRAMTRTSSRCRTVTGTVLPSSLKIRVIPSFLAISPVRPVLTDMMSDSPGP